MKFSEILQSAEARDDCAQICIHFDVSLHPVAVIANRVREIGGDITNVKILHSDAPRHSIVCFELSNEDVRNMVVELSQNELFEVQGLNRRCTGVTDT